MTIICEGCGNEIEEGDALNGFCYLCVEKFHQLVFICSNLHIFSLVGHKNWCGAENGRNDE